ncbi:TetR family transcriptional regulator [Amycolatopsis mediterranei S699]|uniref:TetR family transcriptional regulator n=2 Tax=Amycolatopsis mediterranei TaxID=33910 RepID=A0A0H3CZT8_AMYMU|nr:TetR/AcrR family transcriptional regulator C-terminal domain-containing protein [Amycolatopsis mediterranei]ADJ44174.1 TetR family transcriptional regulator [Amycolatopsis mediterranei U32]AEK40909.1 TetR family transcriptional regulator [Amycolatopsis mediterranei S699]AFO75887.1 TetR family transcriptional regulator [Amycolatopsis mediterranei S699]AGT83016.1 TetR family transcriptional regulator [Amycolatopsis mediterranei RB]KDO06909.1 TetR family transcriptional regulator [Amycolatopsi
MLVWERPEPANRPAPAPLSRDLIVRTAVELADEAGLDAVSLRKLAAVLDVGPMRLYGYIDTKDELLDLMVDAVHAEIRPSGAGWREVLTSVAEATRQAASRHEWFADLIGGRPQLGPNALARGEAVLAALDGVDVDVVMPVAAAVDAYVIGAVRREIAERRAERASGQDQRQWQRTHGPYLERMFATGRFPALETVVRDATHLDADETFRLGLGFLLDGIGAGISAG